MRIFKQQSFNSWFTVVASIQLFIGLFKLLSIPTILYDEPLYSYTALFFSENAHFQHEFHQFSGKEFCFYPFLLGCVFFIFGPSLLAGRLLSVVLGIVGLYFFMKLLSQLSLRNSVIGLLSICFVFLNTNFVAFRIIRPEALLLCLACMLAWYLFKYFNLNITTKKDKISLGFCLAGIISTHMVGALFGICIGISILIFSVKFKSLHDLKWILLGSLLPLSIFIGNILHILVGTGFTSQAAKVTPNLTVFKKNVSLFFLKNYVMGFKRGFIVLFELAFIALACINKRYFIRVLGLSAVFVLAYGLFSISDFIRPYYSLFPILALIIFAYLFNQVSAKKRSLLLGILILYFANHFAGDAFIFYKNFKATSIQEIQTSFKPFLPAKPISIGGPKKLWFISPNLNWLSLNATDTLPNSFYYFYHSKNKTGVSSLSQSPDVYYNNASSPPPKLQKTFKNKHFKLIAEDSFTGYDLIQLYKIY
jgi:hypothetical protein